MPGVAAEVWALDAWSVVFSTALLLLDDRNAGLTEALGYELA